LSFDLDSSHCAATLSTTLTNTWTSGLRTADQWAERLRWVDYWPSWSRLRRPQPAVRIGPPRADARVRLHPASSGRRL